MSSQVGRSKKTGLNISIFPGKKDNRKTHHSLRISNSTSNCECPKSFVESAPLSGSLSLSCYSHSLLCPSTCVCVRSTWHISLLSHPIIWTLTHRSAVVSFLCLSRDYRRLDKTTHRYGKKRNPSFFGLPYLSFWWSSKEYKVNNAEGREHIFYSLYFPFCFQTLWGWGGLGWSLFWRRDDVVCANQSDFIL